MSNQYRYGMVLDGVFHSNRMELRVGTSIPDGIYFVDMAEDDFRDTLAPANIEDAIRAFRRMKKIQVIRGVSFHEGIIPENPVAYEHVPIRVENATCDEFEEIEVVVFKNRCFFAQAVSTDKAFALMDARAAFDEERDLEGVRGVTPEIHILVTLHTVERAEQRQREEVERLELLRQEEAARLRALLAQPMHAIRVTMEASGATIISIRPSGREFEVLWEAAGHRISTIVDRQLHVRQGGFCMSGYDNTQSAGSLPRVLQRYVDDGDYIHLTRVPE